MIGDKGYLVTFRQTDPLYTLDLRIRRNPRVAGELKVNGFSSYIHPMGDDLLLDDRPGRRRQRPAARRSRPGLRRERSREADAQVPRAARRRQGTRRRSTTTTRSSTTRSPRRSRSRSCSRRQQDVHRSRRLQPRQEEGLHQQGRLDHGTLGETWIDEQCAAQKKAAPKAPAASLDVLQRAVRASSSVRSIAISRSLVIDSVPREPVEPRARDPHAREPRRQGIALLDQGPEDDADRALASATEAGWLQARPRPRHHRRRRRR